jgi:hypothetical protein
MLRFRVFDPPRLAPAHKNKMKILTISNLVIDYLIGGCMSLIRSVTALIEYNMDLILQM